MLTDFLLEVFARDQGVTDQQMAAMRRLVAFSTSKLVQDAIRDWSIVAPAVDRLLNRATHKGVG